MCSSRSHRIGLRAMAHAWSAPGGLGVEGSHCPQGQPRPPLQVPLSLCFTCGWRCTKETPLGICNTRRNPQQEESRHALGFPGLGALPALLEVKEKKGRGWGGLKAVCDHCPGRAALLLPCSSGDGSLMDSSSSVRPYQAVEPPRGLQGASGLAESRCRVKFLLFVKGWSKDTGHTVRRAVLFYSKLRLPSIEVTCSLYMRKMK